MMTFNCRVYKHNIIRLVLLTLVLSLGLLHQQVHAAASDWSIKIKTSVGGYNSRITFGEFADATDGYDILYDAPAHTAPAAVVAYFDHPEWGQDDTKFWYDIQSAGQTRQWTFYTDSNLDGQALSFEWYFSNVPADYHITLTDVSTGQSVDMMTETSYSYVSGSLRQFTVTAVQPQPPLLTITSPADGAVVDSANITLTGTATDAGQGDEGIASVTVNGQMVTGGVASGANTAQWSYATTLSEGPNSFTVVATDNSAYNDQATETITVTYTPPNTDTDSDGLQDDWEITHFGNLSSTDADGDSDGDGLSNGSEYTYGTDPNNTDSDGDGITDAVEVDLGIDPTNSDTDGDGDSDSEELQYGSNPALSTDTIALHRPYQPVLQQVFDAVALDGQVFDTEAFDDIDILDGDYLSASRWQISTDQAFTESAIMLDRQLVRDSNAELNSVTHRQLRVPGGVLRKASQYWIRVAHRDSIGLWSDWSDAMSFSTIESDPNDLLGDGIDDRYQVQGYVDTNANGVDDNDEDGIYTISTAAFSETVGLSADAGEIGYLSVMDSSDIATEELPNELFSYHLFDFRIDGLNVDSNNPASVDITFYFPDALPAGTKWYKYDAATQTLSDYSDNAVINDTQVTLTLIDGGAGDADGVVNGTIIDPSGPALPSGTSEGNNASQLAVNSGGSGTHGPIFLILELLAIWLNLRRKNKGQTLSQR